MTVAPRGKALQLRLVCARFVVQHGEPALAVVERAVEDHHPDGVGIELGVGGPQLGPVGQAEKVQWLAAEGEADLLDVFGGAHRIEMTEQRAGELQATCARGLRVGAQLGEACFVLGEPRDGVVPGVRVAADRRAGPRPARVHADQVEVIEHRGGEDRRAARLLRDDGGGSTSRSPGLKMRLPMRLAGSRAGRRFSPMVIRSPVGSA